MHPDLFRIGPLVIRSYAVLVTLGFLAGLAWTIRSCRRVGLDPARISDLAFWAALGGIAGARALYVALDPATGVLDFFKLWEGGLSFHGALLGGGIVFWLFAWRTGLSFLSLADLAAPGVALGQAIGRVGCFFNGCCYGQPTRLPWGVRFVDLATGKPTPPSHPVQLYEMAGDLVIFAVLSRLAARPRRPGLIFFSYLTFYGLLRGWLEIYRAGYTSAEALGPITAGQLVSAGMVVAAAAWFILSRGKPARGGLRPGDET
jgi:phosphatidylglycerol:prolipoprotein diacylglycerol transferase